MAKNIQEANRIAFGTNVNGRTMYRRSARKNMPEAGRGGRREVGGSLDPRPSLWHRGVSRSEKPRTLWQKVEVGF